MPGRNQCPSHVAPSTDRKQDSSWESDTASWAGRRGAGPGEAGGKLSRQLGRLQVGAAQSRGGGEVGRRRRRRAATRPGSASAHQLGIVALALDGAQQLRVRGRVVPAEYEGPASGARWVGAARRCGGGPPSSGLRASPLHVWALPALAGSSRWPRSTHWARAGAAATSTRASAASSSQERAMLSVGQRGRSAGAAWSESGSEEQRRNKPRPSFMGPLLGAYKCPSLSPANETGVLRPVQAAEPQ